MRVQQPADAVPLPHRLAVSGSGHGSEPGADALEVPASALASAVCFAARVLGTGRALSSRELANAAAHSPGAPPELAAAGREALPAVVEAALDLLVLEQKVVRWGRPGPFAVYAMDAPVPSSRAVHALRRASYPAPPSPPGFDRDPAQLGRGATAHGTGNAALVTADRSDGEELENVSKVLLERPGLERVLGPVAAPGRGAGRGEARRPPRRSMQPGKAFTDCLKMIVRDAPDSDATQEKPEYRYFMVFGAEKHRVLAVRSERTASGSLKYKVDPNFSKDMKLGKRVTLRTQKAVQEWLLSLIGHRVPKACRRRVASDAEEAAAGISSRTRTRRKRGGGRRDAGS